MGGTSSANAFSQAAATAEKRIQLESHPAKMEIM
jgi:hypothetical protein